VLGPEHPDTLASMNNLGDVYLGAGKYGLAEALYSKTLEIRRRVLGSEHPSTYSSMIRLGNAYEAEGKFAQAGALYSPALELSIKGRRPGSAKEISIARELGFGRHGCARRGCHVP
jgi:tetratricopeptide (TPR) repeat protein